MDIVECFFWVFLSVDASDSVFFETLHDPNFFVRVISDGRRSRCKDITNQNASW
jgi:hypothetical protein